MIIKQAISYIRKNIVRCLPLLLSTIVFIFVCLFCLFTNRANDYLKQVVKQDITYNMAIEGRLCDIRAINGTYSFGEPDFEDEYNDLMNYIYTNDFSYNPIIKILSTGIGISDDVLYDENCFRESLLYGVDEDYFINHNIEIAEGRSINGNNEIVVNDNTYQYEDGYNTKVQIGDTLSFPVGYVQNFAKGILVPKAEDYMNYTVVGIYKNRNINIMYAQADEYELNNRFYVSKDSCLKHYEKYIDVYKKHGLMFYSVNGYIPKIGFINVTKEFDSEISLNNFVDTCNSFLHSLNLKDPNDEFSINKETTYTIKASNEQTNAILLPFTSLQENMSYLSLLAAISFALVLIMIIKISNRRRTIENGIKMTLGMKYEDVLIVTIIENVIITFVGIVIGYVLYKLSASNIINYIFNESVELQNDLLRASYGSINVLKEFAEITVDYSIVKVYSYEYFVVFIATILLATCVTIIDYRSNQPKIIKKSLSTIQ